MKRPEPPENETYIETLAGEMPLEEYEKLSFFDKFILTPPPLFMAIVFTVGLIGFWLMMFGILGI